MIIYNIGVLIIIMIVLIRHQHLDMNCKFFWSVKVVNCRSSFVFVVKGRQVHKVQLCQTRLLCGALY